MTTRVEHPGRVRMRRWGIVLIGLALAFLPTWAPPLIDAIGLTVSIGVEGPASSILWNAAAVTLLLAYVLLVERRDLASIRIVRPTGKDLEWALILFGCHMGFTWLARTLWPPPADTGTATIAAMPVLLVLALILSAAIFEEILYRGYPLERLTELTQHRWIAVALTLPVFVAPHLVFFGPEWLLYQGSGTAVLYILFLWRRNLVANMLLHACVNLPILIPTIASRLG
jgi:membrane protease YdiL (CAAX protease family)